MQRPIFRFLAGVTLLFGAQARAESWRTVQGETWEGQLSGVYGPIAVIAEKNGSRSVPIDLLDDAGVERVADFVDQLRTSAPEWKRATSRVGKELRGRLQVLREGKLAIFDPGARPEPVVYLAYFGAEWCGPCKRFSPTLVSAYQELKRLGGDRFELVFISSDQDSGQQLRYVREVGMPWPVLKYSSVGSVGSMERWKNRGIPNLIVVTPAGDLIFSSYNGDEYLGPDQVLQKFAVLLGAMTGEGNASRRAIHRLAVVQHAHAAPGGSASVKPYVIELDRSRYQTLEVKTLTALLQLDDHGRVTEAKFEPEQSAVVEYQLVRDAGSWLFLPRVENGKAIPAKVHLPLQL